MTLSSTQTRILSAIVMVLMLIGALLLGAKVSLALVCVVGALTVHELSVNFLRHMAFGVKNILLILIFVIPFIVFNYFLYSAALFSSFTSVAVALNTLLVLYLFCLKMESKFLTNFFGKFSFLAPLFILFPLLSLSVVFHHPKWLSLVVILLFINFGMDTGAWFFGKNFGKHKLWPSVSPNKTIEGLVGGAISSGFLGGICWQIFYSDMKISLFFLFVFLGVMSQVGDLIQSKMKRQFAIKDSSALIPGHGGVYDRIDSLIFLTPFFAMTLSIII